MNMPRQLSNYFYLCVVALTMTILPVTSALAGAKVFDLVTLGNDGSLPQYSLYSGSQSKITPDGRFVVVPEKAEIFIETRFYAANKNCSADSADEVPQSRESA